MRCPIFCAGSPVQLQTMLMTGMSISGKMSSLTAAPRPGARRGDSRRRNPTMCRSIKTLYNFEPPATDEEIRAAALQFVRKLSGFHSPSKANQQAFDGL